MNAESRKRQLENIRKVFWCFNLPLPHSIPEAMAVLNQSALLSVWDDSFRYQSKKCRLRCRLLGLPVLCCLGLPERLCKCLYLFCLHQNLSQRTNKRGWKTARWTNKIADAWDKRLCSRHTTDHQKQWVKAGWNYIRN